MEALTLILDDNEVRYLYDIIRIVGDFPYQKSNSIYDIWKTTLMGYYNDIIYEQKHCVVIKGHEINHFVTCIYLYGRYRAGRNEGRDKIIQQIQEVIYGGQRS